MYKCASSPAKRARKSDKKEPTSSSSSQFQRGGKRGYYVRDLSTNSQGSNSDGILRTRVSKYWKISNNLIIRTGYVQGNLILMLERKVRDVYTSIVLDPEEFMRLKFLYARIAEQAVNTTTGNGIYSKYHEASKSFSIITHYNPLLKKYTVTFVRFNTNTDKGTTNEPEEVRMYLLQSEYESMEKSINWCYYVFEHHPFEMHGSEMNRTLLVEAATEMIRIMEKQNPGHSPISIKEDSLTDAKFSTMFFNAYCELLNLSYSYDIVTRVENVFPKRKQDTYVLFHQIMNHIPELLKTMATCVSGQSAPLTETVERRQFIILDDDDIDNQDEEDYDANDNKNKNSSNEEIPGEDEDIVPTDPEPGEIQFLSAVQASFESAGEKLQGNFN